MPQGWGDYFFEGMVEMQDNIFLQRFQKFRSMIISANIDGNTLLEMAETFIMSCDDEAPVVEAAPVLKGQMSLFDYGIQI